MKPTAISQVLEQLIKLIFGLSLAYAFRYDKGLSASMAALSVTISEIVVVFFLIILKKRSGVFSFLLKKNTDVKSIIKNVVPITLSTIIIPLTRTVESFIIFNILNRYLLNATSLYGLYSGAVESLVGVPVSILYSIAVTSIPIISKEKGNRYKKIKKPLLLTILGSIVFAILFYMCSGTVVNILYYKLPLEDKLIAINMTKLASLSVLTLPIMQTLSASLIACGNLYAPSVASLIASIIKIILSVILLKIKSINIFAVIITDIISYLVACLINLVYINIRNNKNLVAES